MNLIYENMGEYKSQSFDNCSIGYLVYFVLALPFIRKGDADGYDPEEHALIDPDDALPN